MRGAALLSLVREAFAGMGRHNTALLAAGIAFYTVTSLAPLLVIAIAIGGFVFGEAAAHGHVVGYLRGWIGQEAAETVQAMIVRSSEPGEGLLATAVGLGVLLFAASRVFANLQLSLNAIWGVAPSGGGGLIATVRKRLFSFLMVLSVGFLLLLTLVMSTALAALSAYFQGLLPGTDAFWHAANFLIALGLTAFVFAAIFKIIPDVQLSWRDVWPGALLTALLFSLGRSAFAFYLGVGSFASVYGAAGSLVVVLFWAYYSAQILFLGAEFTTVYARRYGTRKGR
jgi:membrane protein